MPGVLSEPPEFRARGPRLRLLGALVVIIALASCGSDPAQESTSTAATSTTTTPGTTTTAPTSTTTTPPDTTEVASDFDIRMGTDTRWEEVFDALTNSEQECIRDAFDGDLLESVLDRSVMAESDTVEAWEILIFSCLSPQTARAVFLDSIIAGMSEDGVLEIDADVVVCLGEWVADLDVVATMLALSVDDPETTRSTTVALMTCYQDMVVALMLEETGLTLEDLSEEEATCLRTWVTTTDWTDLLTNPTEDPSVLTDSIIGLWDCVPDLSPSAAGVPLWEEVIDEATPVEIGMTIQGELGFEGESDTFAFQADEGQYYEIDVTLGTLQDSVLDLLVADGTWLASDDNFGDSTASRLTWQAPTTGTYYIQVTSSWGTYTLTITLSDIVDDHPNSTDNATPVEIGETTQGEVDYGGDSDLFAFQADEGQLYEIDVTLGTLQDSVLDLLVADGTWLAGNDDFGDSTASRLTWQAPTTGTYYIQVTSSWGTDTGTYTLTITRS